MNSKNFKTCPLTEQWVKATFSEAFLRDVKKEGLLKPKMVWCCPGKKNKSSRKAVNDYTSEKNVVEFKDMPSLSYPQGDDDTCLSSALASCLSELGKNEEAKAVNEFGKSNDLSRYLFDKFCKKLQNLFPDGRSKNWTRNIMLWMNQNSEESSLFFWKPTKEVLIMLLAL